MKTTRIQLVVAGLTILAATGCQSAGSRFAWMNPARMWNHGADTAVAEAPAPELPSAQFAANSESAPPATSTTPATESAPPYSNVAANFGENSSIFPPTAPTYTPPASPAATSPLTPQAGPYSALASGTTSPTTPVTAPVTPVAAQSDSLAGNTYSIPPISGFSQNAAPATPPASSGSIAGLEGISVPAIPEIPSIDTYAPFSQTVAAPSTPAASPTTLTPTSVASGVAVAGQAPIAEVQVPNSTGGYRPGGTSTYPDAVNVATRPSSTDSTTPSSAYGVPAYR